MTNTQGNVWNAEHSIETSASPAAIWALFRDAAGWQKWNAGVERVELEGPFASGTWFTMKTPGQDAFRSQLKEVRENELFVDETCVGELVVTVAHRIEPIGAARVRIVYAIQAEGAEAGEIGPAIASDFPDVLASLVKVAERS